MKKNGFTLIEILGVVLILSLLVALAFPTIIDKIKRSEEKLDSASMLIIENATDIYIKNNQAKYPNKVGNVYCITLNDLIKSGNITETFIKSKDENIDIDNSSIRVEIKTGHNNYEILKTTSCN